MRRSIPAALAVAALSSAAALTACSTSETTPGPSSPLVTTSATPGKATAKPTAHPTAHGTTTSPAAKPTAKPSTSASSTTAPASGSPKATQTTRVPATSTTSIPPAPVPTPPASEHGDPAAIAKSLVGTPYSFGGGSVKGATLGVGPSMKTKGFDAPALVQYVSYKSGCAMPRQVLDQWKATKSTSSPKAGDVVFTAGDPTQSAGKGPGDVGVFIGDGKFVVSTWAEKKVVVKDVPKGAAIRTCK